jgi:hypothetical protein
VREEEQVLLGVMREGMEGVGQMRLRGVNLEALMISWMGTMVLESEACTPFHKKLPS